LADLPPTPRQPAFTTDDLTVALVVTVSILGAAAGSAVAYGVLTSGGGSWSAGILGTLIGLGAGAIGALAMARMFRRKDLQGLDFLQMERGIVLWVRVRSPEREALAKDILERNGARAVRVHEIEIEKRVEDLPLSSLRPDPWIGIEPLGHR
jgi:hypothetical protein